MAIGLIAAGISSAVCTPMGVSYALAGLFGWKTDRSDKRYTITNAAVLITGIVIAALGTWDITTIRASMGMYLCCKAIHRDTDIRVLLTGEISDELFGYKYTDFAPSAEAFQPGGQKAGG